MATTHTVFGFHQDYRDSAACLDELMDLRVDLRSTGRRCDRPTRFHRLGQRRAYTCQICGVHVYPCSGAVVEGSRTPLVKKFYSIYSFASSHRRVPARELQGRLDVTSKCDWWLARKIRRLMAEAAVKMRSGEVKAQWS